MAEVGGLLGTAYLITSAFLGSYLSFCYDLSLMKKLFYEEIPETCSKKVNEVAG